MSTKHVLKISSIISYFEDDRITISRGENVIESGHISKMDFNSELLILRGDVYASMKNKTYKIEVYFNDNFDVTDAKCDCPKGLKCHHIAALLLFGHYNISVTDQGCKWNAPKSKPNDNVKTCDEIYSSKPYKAIDRHMTKEEIHTLRNKLRGSTVGLTWLLKEEPVEELQLPIPLIDDVVFNDDFFNSANRGSYITYITTKLSVTMDQIKEVARLTVGQAENEYWVLIRKHRLTASNFGPIIAAYKRGRFPPSLFKKLFGVYNLDGVRAIQWGRNHEKDGKIEFEAATSLEVISTGLWLHTCGYLEASPDGLVGENAIIEIKCPYSYRNDILSEKLKSDKSYIIMYNDNNDIIINSEHHYFSQIQGLLHILNRDICYLVIWSVKETLIVTVEKSESWAENIDLLKDFYLKQYIPALSQNKEL